MKKYSMLTSLSAIILCLLCACSSGKSGESEALNAYERQSYTIPKEYEDTSIHILGSNEQKLLYYESSFEEDNGSLTLIMKDIYEYDLETATSHKLVMSAEQKNRSYHYVLNDKLLGIDKEHNLYLYDSELQVIAQKNIQNLSFPGQDAGGCLINTPLSGLESDGQYIYFIGSDKRTIYVLGENLEEKAVFFAKSDMIIIPLAEDRIGFADCKKKHLYGYDEKKNELTNLGKTADDIFDIKMLNGIVPGNSEYDFFYYTRSNRNKETGIKENYFSGVKGDKKVRLFEFDKMGINDLYIEWIQPDRQNGFWFFGNLVDQETVLYHFTPSETPQDYSPKANKKCIKIGSMQIPDVQMEYALKQFNLQSDAYYFETVVYQEIYEDIDIARMHLFLDCQENRLDGILLDNIEEEMIRNDVLYDLNHYLEQSTVVSKEQFITHYWESVTAPNGEIYALYPSFRGIGYAYDERIDFLNLLQYENLYDEEHTFLSYRGTEDALWFLLRYSGDRFVDEAAGELHIREAAFQNMLQYLKDQQDFKSGYFDPVMQYCGGDSKAARITILEPGSYLYYNRLFHDRVVFSNVGCDGLVIGERKGLLGICNQSENKEAFFRFFDYLYEPAKYHERFFTGLEMPVLKEEYALWKDFFLATESYTDRYGKYQRRMDFQFGYGVAECIIKVGEITEQEAEEAVSALQEIQYIKPMKGAYMQIITEDAADYFSGIRSLDEVCESMENRLRIALEENKERN